MQPTFTNGWRWLALVALVAAVTLPAQAQRNVTLRLNTATLSDTLKASSEIQIRGAVGGAAPATLPDGNVIDWGNATTLRATNAAGDYWESTFQIPNDQEMKFKFFSVQSEGAGLPGGWEDGGDHIVPAGTGDVTLPVHFFEKGADKAYDWRPFEVGGDSVGVWFRVYMKTAKALVDGYTEGDEALVVSVRGDGGLGGSQGGATMDWGNSNIILTRENNTPNTPGFNLFSGLVKYPASAIGQTQNYKFFFVDSQTSNSWEDDTDGGNRRFVVPASDTTLAWKYFSNAPAASGSGPVSTPVTFLVDIKPLVDVGLFNEGRGDFIQVRGAFNGWDCPEGAQDDCALFPIPNPDPNVVLYGNTIEVTGFPEDEIAYKFYARLNNGLADNGWEEPLDTGGGNRFFEFVGIEGQQQDLGTQYFNDIRPGNVLRSSAPQSVTFRVNMANARNFLDEQFNPATDTVFVGFEDPLWMLTQGYEPGELTDGIRRDVALLDGDGDLVYEGTFTIVKPTYNGIGYRYRFGGFNPVTGADELYPEGRGGFDAGRRRYRFVEPTATGTYVLPVDAFRQGGNSGDLMPIEYNPTREPNNPAIGVPEDIIIDFGEEDPNVAIEDIGGELPQSARLSQNYPNPFNPTTTFEYAVARAGQVTLKVYDLMGREVATLLSEVQPAGNYRVDFNASDLASGVYIYTLRTGNTVLSQRMTLLK